MNQVPDPGKPLLHKLLPEFRQPILKHFIERGGMTDAETNQELSNEEVTERLNALYDELKSLKPYLPFQQIKRVLAELKWVKSMREDGVYNDPDPIEETS